MASSLKDIPPLLHDARLTDCRWDRHLKTLDLSFQCLRRNVDGTPIEDSTVDLKLGGVERIVAHYSPASVTVRPSEFETGSRLTLADLEEWPQGAVEAPLRPRQRNGGAVGVGAGSPPHPGRPRRVAAGGGRGPPCDQLAAGQVRCDDGVRPGGPGRRPGGPDRRLAAAGPRHVRAAK